MTTQSTQLQLVRSIIPDGWMQSVCNDDKEICVMPPNRSKSEKVIDWKLLWKPAVKIVANNLRASGLTVRTDGESVWVRI